MKNSILLVSVITLILAGSCSKKSEVTAQKPVTQQTAMVEEKKPATENHATVKLTKQDFLTKVMNYEVNQTEWVFEGDKPCLIDFYADWCAPCRTTAPILEELAREYGDKIVIYKVDTQKEQELASVFGIRSLPSFLFCPVDGQPVMSSGIAQTKEQTKQMFKQQIDEILLQKKTTSL